MSDVPITLEQVFEEVGWIAKWEARGEERGKAEGEARGKAIGEARGEAIGEARGEELATLKIAKNMIDQGFSFETIVSLTQLDPEKVKALYD